MAKRKAATPKQIIAIMIRQDGRCTHCGKKLQVDNIQIDHVVPVVFGGSSDTDNLEGICADPCHKRKTKNDNREAKKSNRIIRKNNPETRRAPAMKSARKIQSRGFDTTLTKRMDGTVVHKQKDARE